MENKMGNVASDTFDIVAENLDKFRFVALAAGSNVTLLADQVKSFKPKLVAVRNESVVGEVKEALLDADYKLKTISGEGDVKIGKINVIIPTMRHALASEGGFCTGSFFSNSGFVQDHVLNVFPYPMTVSAIQFATGSVLVLFMWMFNLYKKAKVSKA